MKEKNKIISSNRKQSWSQECPREHCWLQRYRKHPQQMKLVVKQLEQEQVEQREQEHVLEQGHEQE